MGLIIIYAIDHQFIDNAAIDKDNAYTNYEVCVVYAALFSFQIDGQGDSRELDLWPRFSFYYSS